MSYILFSVLESALLVVQGIDLTTSFHEGRGCTFLTEHSSLCKAFIIATSCPGLAHSLGVAQLCFFFPFSFLFPYWIICYSVLKGLFMPNLRNLVMLPEIAHLLIRHGMVRVCLFLSADFRSENNPIALACSLYLCTYTIVLY